VRQKIVRLFRRWRDYSSADTSELKHIKVDKLQDPEVREQYKDALKSKLDGDEAVNGDDIIEL
jgi:hypothetical protein